VLAASSFPRFERASPPIATAKERALFRAGRISCGDTRHRLFKGDDFRHTDVKVAL
jgi:hypothetical protein